jgi:hypothetical protein
LEGNVRSLVSGGDILGLHKFIQEKPEALHEADELGWTGRFVGLALFNLLHQKCLAKVCFNLLLLAFHEAARSGKVEVVKLLLESAGIDKNLMTNTGVSPLNIARQYRGNNDEDEVIMYLVSIGAQDISPSKKKTIETVDGGDEL